MLSAIKVTARDQALAPGRISGSYFWPLTQQQPQCSIDKWLGKRAAPISKQNNLSFRDATIYLQGTWWNRQGSWPCEWSKTLGIIPPHIQKLRLTNKVIVGIWWDLLSAFHTNIGTLVLWGWVCYSYATRFLTGIQGSLQMIGNTCSRNKNSTWTLGSNI